MARGACPVAPAIHADAVTAVSVRHRCRLLPRNMRPPSFATGVISMIDYSGMNTTKMKHAGNLL
ncbi:hypothetical protein XcodCFBP4690_03040 [Xanthomonas codiaei]|uniref:Uncharacterized protein n=1 Tax=Xanthomonas codiaei TaxID=56463 RepID=A0A2S7CWP2_9XANT|nr:hypothetical protein XcodCFBP4690_03040 [Xanthomonas codiaei]